MELQLTLSLIPIIGALEEIFRESIHQLLFHILQGIDYYYSCLIEKESESSVVKRVGFVTMEFWIQWI